MGKGEKEEEKEKLVGGDEDGFGESRKVEESSIVVGRWKVTEMWVVEWVMKIDLWVFVLVLIP